MTDEGVRGMFAQVIEGALPEWITAMSEQGREMLRRSLALSGIESQAELLAGSVGNERTRQARHAQLMRARSTAALIALLSAAREESWRKFVLSRDFSWVRPFCAEMQGKARSFPALLARISYRDAVTLFEEAYGVLLEAGSAGACADPMERLRAHSAIACMSVSVGLYGAQVRELYRTMYRDAAREGLLDNAHLRLRLASMGSWTGESKAHGEVLLDSELWSVRLSDAYCYVRSDVHQALYLTVGRMIAGDPVQPDECLLQSRPISTLRRGVDYVLACMRDAHHLKTPAQALMLLTAIEDAHQHVRRLVDEHKLSLPVADLLMRVRTFERVQWMEKRRFWALCDQLEEGPAKRRLVELWERDYVRTVEDQAARTVSSVHAR